MTSDPCLVLYGNSVFLAGIKAELERAGTFELLTIEIRCAEALELIRKRQPRALLFDLGTGQLDFVVSLLREQTGMQLIGVGPSSDEILVLSGYSQPARSVSDLVHAINRITKF